MTTVQPIKIALQSKTRRRNETYQGILVHGVTFGIDEYIYWAETLAKVIPRRAEIYY
jgi:hypothetical protein